MGGIMMEEVGQAVRTVLSRINAACRTHNIERVPRLVAVSKTKPKELIFAAYNVGQRHFGENYIQELVDKGTDPELIEKCKDIRWHFIGRIQRNKVNKLLSVPNLFMVETVDSLKLASALNDSWSKLDKKEPLRVMVQVNTSGETEKNGILPSETTSVAKYVVNECSSLKFSGLMTIGRFGRDVAEGDNPDFLCLKECGEEVCKELGLTPKDIELSMGMSHDFEHAIAKGSTNVRVGSTIFGERDKKPSASTELSAKVEDLKLV